MLDAPKPSATKQAAEMQAARNKIRAHPLRLRILLYLGQQEATPKELAEDLGEDFKRVCEHVQILAQAGEIELIDTDEKRGGMQRIYRAVSRKVIEIDEWELIPQADRESSSLVQLRGIIGNIRAAVEGGVIDAHPRRVIHEKPMLLDDQGFAEVDEACIELVEETYKRIAEESANRLHKSGESGISVKASTIVHVAAPRKATGPPTD